MSNHHLRYHHLRYRDGRYEAGYNAGFADAETGRSLPPEELEHRDEGYRLGYANGQRYSLGLDLAEPPLPAKRPEGEIYADPPLGWSVRDGGIAR